MNASAGIEDARRVPRAGTRKAEAYAFIERYLTERGHSPSINDVQKALRISSTRAKQLVHELAEDLMIRRERGAQRGISIPGLFQKLAAAGFIINPSETALATLPCPQGQLPVMLELPHIPDDFDAGSDDDEDYRQRLRTAAGRASGARSTPPKARAGATKPQGQA